LAPLLSLADLTASTGAEPRPTLQHESAALALSTATSRLRKAVPSHRTSNPSHMLWPSFNPTLNTYGGPFQAFSKHVLV